MGIFRRIKNSAGTNTAVMDRAREPFAGNDDELMAEIKGLSATAESRADGNTQRRLAHLRHQAGVRRLESATAGARHAEPDSGSLPSTGSLPEFTRGELTPELLRAAILRDGCALVRELIPREAALGFADQIERAFGERELSIMGQPFSDEYYEPFVPEDPFGIEDGTRSWIRQGGGVLAMDSPKLSAELFAMLDQAQLPQLIQGYLGEPAAISLHKTTLRKATPDVPGAWHQDGRFMGDVRAMNLWLSLSHCGDVAPGLDIVPKRIGELVTAQTDEAMLDYQVSQSQAEQAAGDTPIIRPIFEPGDALLFDDLFLHKTGSDPEMPNPRYAVESWYFGASGFPADYAPIAI